MIKDLTDIRIVKAHFAKVDPKIASVLETVDLSEWFEDRPSSDHFYNLTRNIIYQQLAGKAASTIFGRFKDLVGDIKPEHVIKFEDQSFRDVGLSWAKAKYVKDLAGKIISGELDLAKIDTLDNEGVINELTKVKGIGRWTAEMFLLFTLHRENVFSYLDLGLKNGLIKLYGIKSPTPAQIQKIIKKWSPYESYGSICLWHYLDNR
ncbi:DNA-3-methyladenine glycosylase 2 family protein [Candidatus Woesebacteria bacterium]|nr:DNA-3-methyladenine glycosylase 2 family protein [Candidatus Woesebacteria bacterium]